MVDSIKFMNDAVAQKKRILVEGANALMLDLDFGIKFFFKCHFYTQELIPL